MSEILFLAHRIPYPPNKGDKIRSWRFLKALAERHAVRLGAFVDAEEDLRHEGFLKQVCAEVRLIPLSPLLSRLRGAARAVLSGSITEGVYRNAQMGGWVRDVLARHKVSCVFMFSSGVAQYAELPGSRYPRRVIDLCDVDSDKWRQYAARASAIMQRVYAREHAKLAQAEGRWVREFDATIVISEAERRLLGPVANDSGKVFTIGNGVDAQYFDPSGTFEPVFEPGDRGIVFTGAMDYLANVDGVEWFANEVFPKIRERCPRAVFAIVGSNPHPRVQALAQRPGIKVTGTVPDVRPYLAQAACVAVCLRVARGVQNKLLEAMSMARPIVATGASTVGVANGDAIDGVDIADEPHLFAERVIAHLNAPDQRNDIARQYVLDRFSWDSNVRSVLQLVEGTAK